MTLEEMLNELKDAIHDIVQDVVSDELDNRFEELKSDITSEFEILSTNTEAGIQEIKDALEDQNQMEIVMQ